MNVFSFSWRIFETLPVVALVEKFVHNSESIIHQLLGIIRANYEQILDLNSVNLNYFYEILTDSFFYERGIKRQK